MYKRLNSIRFIAKTIRIKSSIKISKEITVKKTFIFLSIILLTFSFNAYALRPYPGSDLKLLGSFGGSFNDLVVEDGYAYIATSNGLTIIDVSDTA